MKSAHKYNILCTENFVKKAKENYKNIRSRISKNEHTQRTSTQVKLWF